MNQQHYWRRMTVLRNKRFRGSQACQAIPMQAPCGPDKLFTVDIEESERKIAANRIPPQQVCSALPRIWLGQTGILLRREDE